jgi:ketosteroid isomerase-like protein
VTTSPTVVHQARDLANRFVEAFNARDVDALRQLITEGAEFRRVSGEALRGYDGLRALVHAAQDADLRLVPFRTGDVEEHGDAVVVTLPIRELIGPDDVERVAEFEILDGRIAAFALRPVA